MLSNWNTTELLSFALFHNLGWEVLKHWWSILKCSFELLFFFRKNNSFVYKKVLRKDDILASKHEGFHSIQTASVILLVLANDSVHHINPQTCSGPKGCISVMIWPTNSARLLLCAHKRFILLENREVKTLEQEGSRDRTCSKKNTRLSTCGP